MVQKKMAKSSISFKKSKGYLHSINKINPRNKNFLETSDVTYYNQYSSH